MTPEVRAESMAAVLRKAEVLLGRWEPGLNPKSEMGLLLADVRAALAAVNPVTPERLEQVREQLGLAADEDAA